MRPYDAQPELLDDLAAVLALPALDGELLARALLMLEGFVESGLIDETRARGLLAAVRGEVA